MLLQFVDLHSLLAFASLASLPLSSLLSSQNIFIPFYTAHFLLLRVIQGQVSDQNAYAMGGIAGHAGLFSTAHDLFALLHALLFASPTDLFLNNATVHLFTTVYNNSQSSRALGWDTNNYQSSDYLGCGNLSSASWTHTGYTGTEVCAMES